jgi:hypothetical protein
MLVFAEGVKAGQRAVGMGVDGLLFGSLGYLVHGCVRSDRLASQRRDALFVDPIVVGKVAGLLYFGWETQ